MRLAIMPPPNHATPATLPLIARVWLQDPALFPSQA
jgi:hypothetical protein